MSDKRTTDGILVCEAGRVPFDIILQSDATEKCQDLYLRNKETNIISDLINSYAWDTAILFIQTFSTELDARSYSKQNKSQSYDLTGKNGDEYCNINDMSGNAREWTTETTNNETYNCVSRSGYCNPYDGSKNGFTATRSNFKTDTAAKRLFISSNIIFLNLIK